MKNLKNYFLLLSLVSSSFFIMSDGPTHAQTCVADRGKICTVSNACGATAQGITSCTGTCPVSRPANPVGYGKVCTSSTPNACGKTNGTIGCDKKCIPPSDSSCTLCHSITKTAGCVCVKDKGLKCSAKNLKGVSIDGTVRCDGTCSAILP